MLPNDDREHNGIEGKLETLLDLSSFVNAMLLPSLTETEIAKKEVNF